jgi:acetyl-CoA carboxylase/biotin carboxylase 1
MYMPLIASEDGVVQLLKQPGVSLEPGDILGILTLDDPARVNHAKPFEGLVPPMGTPGVAGNKPHQKLSRCLGILNDILDGFDNQSIMNITIKELIDVLHDPQLPFAEMFNILSSLSGRIPSKIEDSIRATMDAARAKGANTEFPATRVKKMMDKYIQDTVPPEDRAMFRTKVDCLYEVVDKYLGGIKGHEADTIALLLSRYASTEQVFGGSIEARVLALREQYKDDLDTAVGFVLSHIKVQSKAKLILALLEYVKTSSLNVSLPDSPLFKVLNDLASLEAKCVMANLVLPTLSAIIGHLPRWL